jgi:hypothetical protein
MHDQRPTSPSQPDEAAGGLQSRGVFADDADAGLGLDDVTERVDLAVAHHDALDGPEPEVGDGPLDVHVRVGHPGGVGRGLLGLGRADQGRPGDEPGGDQPRGRCVGAKVVRRAHGRRFLGNFAENASARGRLCGPVRSIVE